MTKSNSNPFPSIYEDRYYVYTHYDPFDNFKVLYVGHGCGSRAWMFNVPFRSEEHAEHLNSFENRGLIPTDWTEIQFKGLSKEKACEEERKLIQHYKPPYNKIQGLKLLKVTPEVLEEAFKLREQGWSYAKIAEALDLATMTIHRAMNGKSKALEELLERQ